MLEFRSRYIFLQDEYVNKRPIFCWYIAYLLWREVKYIFKSHANKIILGIELSLIENQDTIKKKKWGGGGGDPAPKPTKNFRPNFKCQLNPWYFQQICVSFNFINVFFLYRKQFSESQKWNYDELKLRLTYMFHLL